MIKPKSAASRNVDQYRSLHGSDANYGKSSRKILDLIEVAIACDLANKGKNVEKSILDFGCGKSESSKRIGQALGLEAHEYDPAIPGKDFLPVTHAGYVMNTDVLEHLDETEVPVLISDIAGISANAFFHIATAPAGKTLPNGENAHATVQPDSWWLEKLGDKFETVTQLPSEANRLSVVTWPLTKSQLRKIRVSYALRRKRPLQALQAFFAG